MTYQPEKLNLWDRLFNRYRTEVADRGQATRIYSTHPGFETVHQWVEYRIIDRLTGSVTLKREYLT